MRFTSVHALFWLQTPCSVWFCFFVEQRRKKSGSGTLGEWGETVEQKPLNCGGHLKTLWILDVYYNLEMFIVWRDE